MSAADYQSWSYAALALDPIHIGTGGSRLGRVDNTIVRDPATRIPKIPGSSLAGVLRAYAAMKAEKYPACAGQGQAKQNGSDGHCGQPNCPVCTVFGFARGKDASEGFGGLAAFSDMHALLFPVPTLQGPVWVTSPLALRQSGICAFKDMQDVTETEVVYRSACQPASSLNLGWLYLPVKTDWPGWDTMLQGLDAVGVPACITDKLAVVSDKLFTHVVNSNLEVRTSVSINPATGAAEDGALFTYEALPRGTVLTGVITCKNPGHYRINGKDVSAVGTPEGVRQAVAGAFPYLKHLGIGGMGSRGMGRLHILERPRSEKGDGQ